MSRKGKKGRSAGRCFCGQRLRRVKHCPRCGRVTRAGVEASVRKAAESGGSAFLGKVRGDHSLITATGKPRVPCEGQQPGGRRGGRSARAWV